MSAPAYFTGAMTAAQLAERKKGIGGSDAPKIMAGDWFPLWQLKTGRVPDADLTDVWAVQLGLVTEALNLHWYERKCERPVTRQGEAVISKEYPFLRCTLDGFDAREEAVIQCKHTNSRATIDVIRDRYAAQVMHEMIVTGARKAVLSVIIGSNEPVLELVEFDDFYAAQYVDRAREFWRHVETDTPPTQGRPEVAPPPPAALRKVDMQGNNRFAVLAEDWLRHVQNAKLFKTADAGLKAMVEVDVSEAFGYGVTVKRDRRGLSVRAI